jgi:hypothetical protein
VAVRTTIAAAVIASSIVLLPQAATAAAPLTVTCNGGGCTTDWYKTNVTVAFAWDPTGVTSTSGCDTRTISSDTPGIAFDCKITYGGTPSSTVESQFVIKRDATPPTITGSALARGPDANGWYDHSIGVNFSGSDSTSGIASCTSVTYSGPDSGGATVAGTCTDRAGNVSAPASSPQFKYDATPPSVSTSFSRDPDANGWYNHPVGYAATGTDALSGIATCTSGTYGGPDGRGRTIGVTCTDAAGNSGSAGSTLNYDSTPPSVTGASADRPPDANGWYNHAVSISFTGSDDTSGVASCTNATYKEPDNSNVTVSGSCVDAAGNSSGGSFSLKYDATPPTLTNVAVAANNKFVSLTWKASADTTAVHISRTPGTSGVAASTVYTGLGTLFDDRTVANHVKYKYTITAVDQADNKAVETISVTPAAALYSPAQGAVVRRPPLLAWQPVKGAPYYNLQLFRGSKKILSAWPMRPRYRLSRGWKYNGHRYALSRGKYQWRVWPGIGKRTAHKYGPLLGHSGFVVR